MKIRETINGVLEQLVSMVTPDKQVEAMNLIEQDPTLNEEVSSGGDGQDYKQMYETLLQSYRAKFFAPTVETEKPHSEMVEETAEPTEETEEKPKSLEELGY